MEKKKKIRIKNQNQSSSRLKNILCSETAEYILFFFFLGLKVLNAEKIVSPEIFKKIFSFQRSENTSSEILKNSLSKRVRIINRVSKCRKIF